MSAVSSLLGHGEVAVDDTATLVVPANTVRKSVVVRNMDPANTVYVGVAGVTDASGFPLLPGADAGEAFRFEDYNSDVYAICAAGESADVRFIEVG